MQEHDHRACLTLVARLQHVHAQAVDASDEAAANTSRIDVRKSRLSSRQGHSSVLLSDDKAAGLRLTMFAFAPTLASPDDPQIAVADVLDR